MLKAEGLSVYYGEYRAVDDLSFVVGKAELVTFIGANGAGKTSTIRAILGLVDRIEVEIWFVDQNLQNVSYHLLVKIGIRIVPDGRKIFTEFTCLKNLQLGAYFIQDRARFNRNLDWVVELFPILAERKNPLGRHLSGGEQQMLAIARALIGEPKLLLIDEISMGLMPIAVDRAFDLIKKVNEEGMTILLVEQNAKKALTVAKRGYVLETGRIVLQDTASNLEQNPLIKKAYLGG